MKEKSMSFYCASVEKALIVQPEARTRTATSMLRACASCVRKDLNCELALPQSRTAPCGRFHATSPSLERNHVSVSSWWRVHVTGVCQPGCSHCDRPSACSYQTSPDSSRFSTHPLASSSFFGFVGFRSACAGAEARDAAGEAELRGCRRGWKKDGVDCFVAADGPPGAADDPPGAAADASGFVVT